MNTISFKKESLFKDVIKFTNLPTSNKKFVICKLIEYLGECKKSQIHNNEFISDLEIGIGALDALYHESKTYDQKK